MAILKIAKMGDPVLRARAREVPDPTAPSIRALIRDMVETLADAGGVGLAAPQVHVPLRIVVFRRPPEAADAEDGADATDSEDATNFEDDAAADEAGSGDDDPEDHGPGPLHILVNPVIEPLSDETAFDWEACLSVPGMRGVVGRFTRIRYCGLGPDGKPIAHEAQGFHARVVQHECDHLDGILYPQRMTDLRLLGFNDELDRHPLEFAPDHGQADAPADGEEEAAEGPAAVAQGGGAEGA